MLSGAMIVLYVCAGLLLVAVALFFSLRAVQIENAKRRIELLAMGREIQEGCQERIRISATHLNGKIRSIDPSVEEWIDGKRRRLRILITVRLGEMSRHDFEIVRRFIKHCADEVTMRQGDPSRYATRISYEP